MPKNTYVKLDQHQMEVELSSDWLKVLVASGLRAQVMSKFGNDAFINEPTFRTYLAETLDDLGIQWNYTGK